MNCTCGSDRILNISGKCSDMCSAYFGDKVYDGYVPDGLNVGGGDYLEFNMCLNCGKVQGEFPLTDEQVSIAFKE